MIGKIFELNVIATNQNRFKMAKNAAFYSKQER